MSQSTEFDLLMIGVDDTTSKAIQPFTSDLRVRAITTPAEVEELIESIQLPPGMLVLVSSAIKELSQFEIGQALSSSYAGIHINFVTSERSTFDLTNLKKNGFTDTFLFPMDIKRIEERIETVKVNKLSAFKKYKAVKVVDIKSNQKLPFEVRTFLPLNNKYVKLTKDGVLSDKKAETLKSKNINSVFIDVREVEAFYDFAAEQMMSLGLAGNDAVSETEKQEQFQSNVRNLFRSFLDVSTTSGDLEQGRDLLEQSKKVVESYVIKKTGLDLRSKFREILGTGGDSYSHAQSVSTIASLLSMATGIGKPEEVAIAGLFHDIGKQGVGDEVSVFNCADLEPEVLATYHGHPRLSLSILREKRVTLIPLIAEMIEKHHERVDGRGFPGKVQAHKIPIEAQLLSYADAFEHLSGPHPGMKAFTPAEIHAKISAEVGISIEVLSRIEKFVISVAAPEGDQGPGKAPSAG